MKTSKGDFSFVERRPLPHLTKGEGGIRKKKVTESNGNPLSLICTLFYCAQRRSEQTVFREREREKIESEKARRTEAFMWWEKGWEKEGAIYRRG